MDQPKSLRQQVVGRSRWFTLGLGLKRWLLVLGLGASVAGMGVVYLILILNRAGWLPPPVYDALTLQFLPAFWRAVLPLLVGGLIMLLAVVRLGRNLVQPFLQPGENVAQSLYDHSRRGRGPAIVAIGGGTGLPSLLRGLREYTSNITAIITVADDGGSSGRLRRELGLPPPGDFRNNMAALSRDEALMTQLFQYRFGRMLPDGSGELQGHAFGNLLLAALTGITGSFDEALLAAARVLSMRGQVLPSTLDEVTLVADVLVPAGGGPPQVQRISGESAIPDAGGEVQRLYLDPAGVRAYPYAIQAILQADLIVLGPGSLYTSILPNLLVRGITAAVHSARAPKVYACNLATQPGETDNYGVIEHVDVLHHYCADCIDIVLANDNLSVPPTTGGGHTIFVQPTWPPARPGRSRLVTADLVDEQRPWRHDSTKLARAIMDILGGNTKSNIGKSEQVA